MIFNSLSYFLFLTIIVVLYWRLSYRARMTLVFISSLTFYGFWKVEFIPVMLLSVIIDYFMAINIYKNRDRISVKKIYLYISLFVNLSLLFYFKYLLFFSNSVIGLSSLFDINIDPLVLNIILPLGISFYTFQTISYTVDVYRGFIKPEKDFILYANYVTFFPQLIAGPVLRAAEVIGQFKYRPKFSSDCFIVGVKRIVYGIFLKVVLADNIAPLVDDGFLIAAQDMSAIDVWTLSFLFGFQIYFDFSAYSHIAIGSAKLLGIEFPENFRFPYISSSPREFWKRWHISLSSWIRDYLYLPLLGVRVHDKSIGGLANATLHKKNGVLLVTWILMGFWHGANWTFALWGLYHAILILLYRITSKNALGANKNIKTIGGVFITLPLIMLSWIPFRADSVENTFTMWSKVLDFSLYSSLGMRENTYLITFLLLVFFFLTYFLKEKIYPLVANRHTNILFVAESFLFFVMVPLVIIFLRPVSQFIYFQF